jgi:hypothetical protein
MKEQKTLHKQTARFIAAVAECLPDIDNMQMGVMVNSGG